MVRLCHWIFFWGLKLENSFDSYEFNPNLAISIMLYRTEREIRREGVVNGHILYHGHHCTATLNLLVYSWPNLESIQQQRLISSTKHHFEVALMCCDCSWLTLESIQQRGTMKPLEMHCYTCFKLQGRPLLQDLIQESLSINTIKKGTS